MPTNPSSTANLPCEQCGYLNEPERVYCHNCGSKLDRSLLPKSEAKKSEDPTEARKRISKMTNPKSNVLGRELKALLLVAIWSVVVAAVIVIAEKPDGVPDPKLAASSTRLVSSDMMEALEAPTPRPISFTEDEINGYFKKQIKPVDSWIPGIELERVFVNCLPGALRISAEESVFGYSLYGGVDFHLSVENGKFSAKIIAGHLGRLQIDPQILNNSGADSIFKPLQEKMSRERKQMDQMQSVNVVQGRVDLVTKPAAAR